MNLRLPNRVKYVRSHPVFVSTGVGPTEVISGYASHERTLSDIRLRARKGDPTATGPASDNAFKIGRLAHEVASRFKGLAPVREIVITGHADLVFRHGVRDLRDEDDVSTKRAEDVLLELITQIKADHDGHFTPGEFDDAIRNGQLTLIVNSMGARKPLRSGPGAVPENRRVAITLFLEPSVPI
jgi:flagellar motor protein MotB